MAEQAEKKRPVQLTWGVKIPMRDGVHLNATLYLPKDWKEPRPAIFCLTPYTGQREHPEAYSFAEHGYPALTIDVRGRGDSEGEFVPFAKDAPDGHDVVEWIAKQPWCNGKVGMRGLSYVGYTQWATVQGDPPHLATIVPSAPCYIGLDYPIRFNVFFSFSAAWLIFIWGKTRQDKIFEDQAYFSKEYLRFFESGRPFKELDSFFGFESQAFRKWFDHPHRDEYWDQFNPAPEQYAKLTMPILSLTGAYDGDQPGTLEFYHQHLKHAGNKANHYLVIGPWDHEGVREPKAQSAGLTFGPASVLDMPKLHREWYAFAMEDGPRPEFLEKKVAHYVAVADKWRYSDTLEETTARVETLYLDLLVNPTDEFQAGTMTKDFGKRTEPDHFVYDPRDLTVPKAEAALFSGEGFEDLADAPVEATHLTYNSAPFEQDTEVTGFFRLTAWLAIDTPDTDFSAMIFEVAPGGAATYLGIQHLRARYREGLRVEKLIETTDPLPYEFEHFFYISRKIEKGHRLRLVIGPNHTINWQKNYNSGKPNADETMADARTAHVKLFHDKDHPSALHVPIGRSES